MNGVRWVPFRVGDTRWGRNDSTEGRIGRKRFSFSFPLGENLEDSAGGWCHVVKRPYPKSVIWEL